MTMFHVIKPDGSYTSGEYVGTLEFGTPAWSFMRQLVEIKENESLEHVSVLWQGKQAHMFVDEEGRLHNKPRNEKATRIYYNNKVFFTDKNKIYDDLSKDPKTDRIEELEGFDIVGTAVLWEGDME